MRQAQSGTIRARAEVDDRLAHSPAPSVAPLARAVAARVPHHVTQRGNQRQPTFCADSDDTADRTLLASACRRHGIVVWAWCLMPNHVHPILVPDPALRPPWAKPTSATRGRPASVSAGSASSGRAASRPARSSRRTCSPPPAMSSTTRSAPALPRAEDWPWSGARAHLAGRDDGLAVAGPLLDAVRGPSGISVCGP